MRSSESQILRTLKSKLKMGIESINTNDIPDSVLLKYCIRDYKREKQLREQAEHDLDKLKHSLDIMTTMCEMVTQPTQQIITEQVNRRIGTYKSEAIKLNEKIAELRSENQNLETVNRELLKRIVALENKK